MGNPELSPDCPFFLLVEHPPIPLEHWKLPMAVRFCETHFTLLLALCCFLCNCNKLCPIQGLEDNQYCTVICHINKARTRGITINCSKRCNPALGYLPSAINSPAFFQTVDCIIPLFRQRSANRVLITEEAQFLHGL